MIIFKTLTVNDFKSIKQAKLHYSSGVWHVVGTNNDAVFESNGSGKTTILEAIQQCLFNKTTSPTPIEDTSRKVSSGSKAPKGFRLEATFTKGADEFTVINDRRIMRIDVLKNGKNLHIKTMPNALRYIQGLLGMDFNTFVTLTFINHDTIVDLLDNFSSSALMKVVLNFSHISSFEKEAKDEQKYLTKELHSISDQVTSLNDALEVLNQFQRVDVTQAALKKLAILDAKKKLQDDLTAIEDLEETLRTYNMELTSLNMELTNITERLTSAICSSCGSRLEFTDEELVALGQSQSSLKDQIDQKGRDTEELVNTIADLRSAYTTKAEATSQELDTVEQFIAVALAKNQLYDANKDKVDELSSKKNAYEQMHKTKLERLSIIQAALAITKSGEIQGELLTIFVALLNANITTFIQFVALDYISIKAESSNSNVAFSIIDNRFCQHISIHTLSGGEKTRLRLVVLLAMLKTIRELANISTNILVFDESLDTLDKSAAKDLANLFSYLVNIDEKFIALISHGAQLSDIQFTGKLLVTKTDGISSVVMETL
jgi:DNA repair exonuclease SbcCD ATPase subunit